VVAASAAAAAEDVASKIWCREREDVEEQEDKAREEVEPRCEGKDESRDDDGGRTK
jgi:hypothetical protein